MREWECGVRMLWESRLLVEDVHPDVHMHRLTYVDADADTDADMNNKKMLRETQRRHSLHVIVARRP